MEKKYVVGILSKLVQSVVITILTVTWAWPLYFVGLLIWGRPPIVPRVAQILDYAWCCLFQLPDQPLGRRLHLFAQILSRVSTIPLGALAWYLNEILYGNKLDNIKVKGPLFVMSAGRSGSTQVALYLEDDPDLAAPNMLQCMMPFLWLWKIVPVTLGRFFTQDMIRKKVREIIPKDLVERHEGDPFRTNTFDGAFYSWHLNYMSFSFSPEFSKQEFGFAKFYTPLRQKCWEEDFVGLVDRLARKTLLQYSQNGKPNLQFFLKGHFLAGGSALAQRFPDARFLTIVREPAPRLRSGINFLRVNPADPVLGPTSWEWLAKTLEVTEIDYCNVEQDWFIQKEEESKTSNLKICVLPFSTFCKDLKGSMEYIYDKLELSSRTVPASIPSEHPERERKNYSVDKSLKEFGIDEDALNDKLRSFRSWCEALEKSMPM